MLFLCCVLSGVFTINTSFSEEHKICFKIDVGGKTETNRCIKQEHSKNSERLKPSIRTEYDSIKECYPDGLIEWYDEDEKKECSPANAPKGSGICRYFKENGVRQFPYNWAYEPANVVDECGLWSDKNKKLCYATQKEFDDCKSKSGKTVAGKGLYTEKPTSCAAVVCYEDYLLWTTNTRPEDLVKVVGENRTVGSQGLCFSKKELQKKCDEKCSQECDGPNTRCELKERIVENRGKKVAAFIGEEACVCVDTSPINTGSGNTTPGASTTPGTGATPGASTTPGTGATPGASTTPETGTTPGASTTPETGTTSATGGTTPGTGTATNCVYRYEGQVICQDKTPVKYEGNEITLTSEQMGSFTCDEFNKQFKNNMKKLLELAPELCKGHELPQVRYVNTNNSNANEILVANAKTTVSDFFTRAKGNLSVWKTAEGKFNTARLASDLTAGVVLGTVGGVVSGVVIKKKQVEKGFDALHCAVGGQTVADWGDTFTVGLR